MLEIQGNLGGKDFPQPTIISAREFAELHGGIPQFKQGELYSLLIHPNKITIRDGEERFPPSCSLPAFFQASLPDGSSFTLRYYRTRVPLANNTVAYQPQSMVFGGKSMGFSSSDFERFVFFASHPKCADSPVAKDPHYYIFDQSKVEAQGREAADRITQMIAALQQAPAHVVAARAMSMVVNGRRANVQPNAPVDVQRTALMELVFANPQQFINQWYSEDVGATGMVRLAIDKGIVKQGVNSGQPVWQLPNGEILVFFNRQDDPTDVLMRWAIEKENKAKFANIVAEGMNAKAPKPSVPVAAKEEVAPEPINEKVFEVAQSAISAGFIYQDGSAVMIEMPDEEPMVLFTAKNPSKWVAEVVSYLEINEELYEKLQAVPA